VVALDRRGGGRRRRAATAPPRPPRHDATAGAAPQFQRRQDREVPRQPDVGDDAIVQLNLTHASVLVFRSLEAGNRVSVVYRRDDGSYGLIETPAAS
jgi:hypothetical protein